MCDGFNSLNTQLLKKVEMLCKIKNGFVKNNGKEVYQKTIFGGKQILSFYGIFVLQLKIVEQLNEIT